MFKRILLLLVCIIFFVSSVIVMEFSTPFLGENINRELKTDDLSYDKEEKIFSKAVIEDDFRDDIVIVILKREDSKVNGEIKLNNFETEKIAIADTLMSDLSINAKVTYSEQSDSNNSKIIEVESITDLMPISEDTENNPLINYEDFHQILSIEISPQGKENVLEAIAEFEKLDTVLAAEPEYINQYEVCATPNDPRYSEQWALPKISAPSAWDITKGSTSVKVGVLDTGVLSHSDLNANVVTGYSDPAGYANTDQHITHYGHGTRVAGIIGAKGNNNIGISGICWNVTIVPMQYYTTGWVSITKALNYAINNNIPIINMSFGGYNYSNADYTSIKNYNGLVVAAACNDNKNNDVTPAYPASYDLPNIISVGATNSSDARWASSNYGAKTVHLFAPGTSILSTVPTSVNSSGYSSTSGTSLSAPYVAGVAALIKSIRADLTAEMIKDIILFNVDKISGLSNNCVSGGRLNAYKAVNAAQQSGWRKISGLWYYTSSGTYLKNNHKIDGHWYYFHPTTGAMQTGWQTVNGNIVYYNTSNGKLIFGTYKIGDYWYYFSPSNGVMQTGWQSINGNTHYYDTNGRLIRGTYKIGDYWYYFHPTSGIMQTGWQTINGNTHYYDTNGRLIRGTYKIGDYWYYFHPTNGIMQTGWQTINGDKHYYDTNGRLIRGTYKIDGYWYYFHPTSGIMQTGWQTINGNTHYYNTNGRLLFGWQQISGNYYHFHTTNAIMATGQRQIGTRTYLFSSNGILTHFLSGSTWLPTNVPLDPDF